MRKKFIVLILLSLGIGLWTRNFGLSNHQALSVAIFSASILGTLFFWDFRLSFAFLGTSVLLLTRTIDIDHLVKFASLDVILFLVGMMILVGLMKNAGFFAWIVQLILRIKHLNAYKFVLVISFVSALLSAVTSEVVSIIFMVAAILEICDYFEVESVPYIMIAVFATNVGSAATVLGNPIGILIASRSGLSFEDFIVKAFPLAVVCLLVTVIIVIFWYRKSIQELGQKIKEFGSNDILIKLISIPAERELKVSMAIFGITLFFIALHHRLEVLLGLEQNTILLIMPLLSSGCVMIWKWKKAREFVEKDVEWWTLLFFMLLFAQAGTLKYTGTTDILAKQLSVLSGNSMPVLIGIILWISTIGSSILDNVVLVAALIPVIQSFHLPDGAMQPLWWALLFGGCLGGNITLVGSTANIVALGILEKEKNIKMTFFQWFWVGLFVGLVTTCVVWLVLVTVPFYK